MATRIETQKRRDRLRKRLLDACRPDQLKADEPLPPMRQLAVQSRLSLNSVCAIVGELAEQGVLHTLKGMGTFPGAAPASQHVFLGLFPADVENRLYFCAARTAFEERISALGGASLILSPETARRYRESGELPALAGVFEFSGEEVPLQWDADVPHVRYGLPRGATLEAFPFDTVTFDDEDGGQQATRHLLSLGHKRIAFLGLHGPGDDGFFGWSQERESGWKQALEAAEISTEGLSFCPARSHPCDAGEQGELAFEAATRLVKNREISAVVAVNAGATHSLFRALREAKRSPASWPAVVGFDSQSLENPDSALPVVTALLLPWKNIGREAASLLWERNLGRGGAQAQHRVVSMNLIRRFSCRGEWERAPGTASLGIKRNGETSQSSRRVSVPMSAK